MLYKQVYWHSLLVSVVVRFSCLFDIFCMVFSLCMMCSVIVIINKRMMTCSGSYISTQLFMHQHHTFCLLMLRPTFEDWRHLWRRHAKAVCMSLFCCENSLFHTRNGVSGWHISLVWRNCNLVVWVSFRKFSDRRNSSKCSTCRTPTRANPLPLQTHIVVSLSTPMKSMQAVGQTFSAWSSINLKTKC